ncbi:hypothetical protein M0804_013466 [Polistes exclamans]|nr:hypothetical protein M0804_013466 [Polistes exclamans]
MFLTIFLSSILLLFFLHCKIRYGRIGRILHCLPGPKTYPIIGNLLCVNDCSLLQKIWKLNNEYFPIYKMWTFMYIIVFVLHPDDIKVLLTSTKAIYKDDVYNFLRPWLSYGLLTSSETALGTSLKEKKEIESEYRNAVHTFGKIVTYRLIRPWYYSDCIFGLSPDGRLHKKVLNTLHRFSEDIIAERKRFHEKTDGKYLYQFQETDNVDTSSQNSEEINTNSIHKKRLSMLDLLIAASLNGNQIDDKGIREEVDTFMFEVSCQKYAMLELKLVVAHIVRNFYLEPVDNIDDVVMATDITLNPSKPLRVKFIPVK